MSLNNLLSVFYTGIGRVSLS